MVDVCRVFRGDQTRKKLILPRYPYGETAGSYEYSTTTFWERMVSSYTGLNFHEVRELELVEYLTYRRDAYIYSLEQTEEGREYLENAWRMEQTKPDRSALRAEFGKEKRDGK